MQHQLAHSALWQTHCLSDINPLSLGHTHCTKAMRGVLHMAPLFLCTSI